MQTEQRKRQRLTPRRLPEKLQRIRLENNLTQAKMLGIVNPSESDVNRARVSQYEKGLRAPSIIEFYHYAKFADVAMETLADDALDLPAAIRQQGSGQNEQSGKPAMGNEAKDAKTSDIPGGGDAPDDAGNSSEEQDPEPGSDSAFKSATAADGEPSQTANNRNAAPATSLIRLSEETARDCKAVYLKLLGELPFDKMGRITPDQLVEQMIAAALDDYRAQGVESALASRMRLFFEEVDKNGAD